jgi:predicted RNase H-like HicB family nuclease
MIWRRARLVALLGRGRIAPEAAMTEYAIVIENAGANLSAYVPDLPGCIATGNSVEDVTAHIREAIGLHLESLREYGEAVPPPTSRVGSVQVA